MHRISLCAHQSYTATNRDSAFATFLRVKNLYSKFCPSGRPLVNNLGSIDPFYPYHLGIVSGEYGVRQDPARHARKQACQAEATTLLLNAGQLTKSCDDSRKYLLLVLEVFSCQHPGGFSCVPQTKQYKQKIQCLGFTKKSQWLSAWIKRHA